MAAMKEVLDEASPCVSGPVRGEIRHSTASFSVFKYVYDSVQVVMSIWMPATYGSIIGFEHHVHVGGAFQDDSASCI